MPIAGKKNHADIFSNQLIVSAISRIIFEELQCSGNNIGICLTRCDNADIICGKHFSRPQRRKCGEHSQKKTPHIDCLSKIITFFA